MDFHLEIRDKFLTADMNVRYWAALEQRFRRRDMVVRLVLAAGAVASLLGMVAGDEAWKVASVWVSGAAALLSTLVLPAIEWNRLLPAAVEAKALWVGIRSEYEELRRRVGDSEPSRPNKAEFSEIVKRDNAAEKAPSRLPRIPELLDAAREEVVAVHCRD